MTAAQRKYKPYELEMKLADMVEAGIDAGLKHEVARLRDELRGEMDAIWKGLRKLQKDESRR